MIRDPSWSPTSCCVEVSQEVRRYDVCQITVDASRKDLFKVVELHTRIRSTAGACYYMYICPVMARDGILPTDYWDRMTCLHNAKCTGMSSFTFQISKISHFEAMPVLFNGPVQLAYSRNGEHFHGHLNMRDSSISIIDASSPLHGVSIYGRINKAEKIHLLFRTCSTSLMNESSNQRTPTTLK